VDDSVVDSALAAIQRASDLAGTDPDGALELLRSSVPVHLRRAAPGASARAGYLRARLLAERGEYDAALGAIRSARRDWLAAGDVLQALSTDLGKATVLHELGEYRTAVEVSEALLDGVGQLSLDPGQLDAAASVRARAHHNLGNAWHRLGDHRTALHHYDLASNLFRSLDLPAMEAETDANRGLAYLKLGLVHRAVDELTRAEAALRRLDRRRAAAKCRVDLAEAHLHLDQVDTAVELLTRTRPVLEELSAVPELARLGLVLSSALLQAGLPGDAHREATGAADTFGDLSMVDDSARAMFLSGIASMQLTELDRAGREFAAAERLFADCGDAGYEARTWLARADLCRRTGDLRTARKLAARAAARLEERDEGAPAAYASIVLAEVAANAGEAAGHLARARHLVSTLDLASLQLVLELARARSRRRAGRAHEAAEVLRTALARSLTAPRDSTTDAELRIALHAAGNEAAEELIDILVEEGTHQSVTEAWQRASAAKTRALDEYVARARSRSEKPRSDLGGAWAVGDLARMYDAIYDDMASTGDADASLIERVREVERRLLEMAASNEPAPTRRPAPVVQAQPAVPVGPTPVPEGPVLQYHVLGKDLVAFVIREGQVHARRLRRAVDPTRQLVRAWRAECSRLATAAHAVAEMGGSGAAPVPAMAQLHDLLVAPVSDLLGDLEGEPLLLIPHQHLFAVPFEALVHEGRTLAERYRLSSCVGLSASSFVDRVGEPAVKAGSTLVLAVPDEDAPGTGAEAEVVGTLRPGAEVFVGPGAMSRTLTRRVAGKEIVHIACHAAFRAANPLQSGLMLADRWMTAEEVIELDLTDALVVLSGCATGRGSESLGEPAGLSWAFVAAGCRAVIAAKWVVDDDVAAELMRAFYTHLNGGLPARDALDRARKDLARTHPHPYHWAAFQYLCSPTTALTEGLSP
jgi:tetratricopeptide (TPR) repeat protein